MRRVFTLGAVFVFVSTLAYAETFTGKLFDAGCAAQQKDAACTPTTSTTSFGIQASGKVLKLDATGNQKAAAALKERNSSADRAKDPAGQNNSADRAKEPNAQNNAVMATVQGTLTGDEIKVEAIELH